MSSASAKAAMRRLADEAKALVDNKSLSAETKRAGLDKIEAELKKYEDEIKTCDAARIFAGGGNSAFFNGDDYTHLVGGKSFGGPRLLPSQEQAQALHQAAVTKQNLRVEMKSALDLEGSIPATLDPLFVTFRREPTRVASLFPNTGMPGPSMEYIRHTGNTGSADTVLPGAAKPEIVPITDTVTAVARKIAAHIGVNDESLLDFQATNAYLTGELMRAITSAENQQLLSGNGTAPNLEGILNTTGLITRTQGAAPETPIDTLEMAMNDLRVGASFTEATGVVMNPADWSAIRLLKNTYGEYLLGHPAQSPAGELWGLPVVVTTDMPAKTVLLGNFGIGGELLIRNAPVLETQSTGTDWTSNITRFRCEERIALAIYRPSAFVKVNLS